MQLFIGLDVGTSAVKGLLVSPDGRKIASGLRRVQHLHPSPERTEIDPNGHYQCVTGLIRELAGAVPTGDIVAALSMAFASGNTILLDEANNPLTNIISWLDRRTVGLAAMRTPGFDPAQVHAVVGWPASDGLPLAHLAWLKLKEPELYRQAARVAMNVDWLGWRFTGRWGLDHSTATTFYLQDQVARRYHTPYLEFLGLRESALSPLAPSGTPLGPLTSRAAADTGLPAGTLVVLGAFDHPCAARGTAALNPGDLLISCGTSWVGFYPWPERRFLVSQGMLVDPFLSPQGPWGGMSALTAVGTTVEWVISNLVLGPRDDTANRYQLFNEAAMRSTRGAGGLFLNPLQTVEALGKRAAPAGTRREASARAIMEGTAFEMKRQIESLARAGLVARRVAMVGGPSESPVWPRIVAEVTGLTLSLVNGQTAAAMGAAVLAGIGAGIFADERDAAVRLAAQPQIITPAEDAVREYGDIYCRYREAVSAEAPRVMM